jgi:hypothetical protein
LYPGGGGMGCVRIDAKGAEPIDHANLRHGVARLPPGPFRMPADLKIDSISTAQHGSNSTIRVSRPCPGSHHAMLRDEVNRLDSMTIVPNNSANCG